MNKVFSFLSGALCGALVGAVTAVLLAPTSGEELRADAKARWDEAMLEAQKARVETQARLEGQFNQMKQG